MATDTESKDSRSDTIATNIENSMIVSDDDKVTQDLRSVLVTSVLNLEKLDTDLYRCVK